MDPNERERVDAIIEQVLAAVAREAGKDRAWLSLEIEQVVARAVFEAHRLGARPAERRRSSATLPQVASSDDD